MRLEHCHQSGGLGLKFRPLTLHRRVDSTWSLESLSVGEGCYVIFGLLRVAAVNANVFYISN